MKWGRKDPELYVLGAIYAGIFGAAGFHLGKLDILFAHSVSADGSTGKKGGNAKPEANIAIPHEGMPWEGPDADANKDNPNYKCMQPFHSAGFANLDAAQCVIWLYKY